MLLKAATCLLLLLAVSSSMAQENAPPNALPRVAPALRECYQRRDLFERDNRLPMTPNMLIELIRKVEDSPGFTLNIQQLTTSLLHRYKQDGIIREEFFSLFIIIVIELLEESGRRRLQFPQKRFNRSRAEEEKSNFDFSHC